MVFDLGKIQKEYPAAYQKFREYLVIRLGENSTNQMIELHLMTELGMKNTHLPAFEGYFMNFFNKYDMKISLFVTKRGKWIPKVFMWRYGEYRNRLGQEFENRHEAVIRVIEYCFSRLNVDLIVNYQKNKTNENKS